jgi:hypothetical protein
VKKYEFLTFFTKSSKSGKTTFFNENDDEKEVFLHIELVMTKKNDFILKFQTIKKSIF